MARRGKRPAATKAPTVVAASELVTPAPRNARLEEMARVAKQMEGWSPARQVLRRVSAVPTIFPSVDQGLRVGGWPIERIATVHGPSNEGKTIFTLGLMLSFLKLGHFAANIDAEMTTPITWCEGLMAEHADHPGFVAMRPKSYEEANDGIRRFFTRIGEAKVKGRMPKDTSALAVVDSIQKLTPKGLLAKIMKEGSEKAGFDGMRGAAGRTKAALFNQWLVELVPLLHETGGGIIFISREYKDVDADAYARKFDNDYVVGGGGGVKYDASIVARVTRKAWVYQGAEEERNVVGERHLVRITKTKVSGKEEKVIDTFFHTSNGSLVPAGFDRARDVLEIAKQMGVVKGDAWLSWREHKWQGENQAVKKLTAQPDALAELEAEVRQGFVVEGTPAEKEPA